MKHQVVNKEINNHDTVLEDKNVLPEDQKALLKSNYISYYDGDNNSNDHAVIKHFISL